MRKNSPFIHTPDGSVHRSPDPRQSGLPQLTTSVNAYVANNVDITFKDQFVSRRDMWKFIQEREGMSIYKGQVIETSQGVRARVRGLID